MEYPKSQLFVALCVYIGQIVMGFTIGWSAPIIPKLQDPEQTPLPDVITDQEASWIVSLVYLGCIGGPYVTGLLLNVAGRKPCLILAATLNFLAILVLALANSLAMIYTGRILIGLGSGIILIVNLVYLGEIASTEIRGILLTGTSIFTTVGSLIVFSLGPYVQYSVTNYVGVAITGLHVAVLFFIPETPLFFMLKGNEDKAKAVLIFLDREKDIDELMTTQQEKSALVFDGKHWSEIFSIRSNRKAFFITLSLFILQQLSGFVVVMFFATTIFELANSSVEPNLATILIGVTQVAGSSLTPFLVERSGRRLLLLLSTAGSCLGLVVLGAYFYLEGIESPIAASVQWLPLVTLIFFFFTCDFGFAIIPATFVGEMFTPHVRSTGSTLTITASWLVGFGISLSFSAMLNMGPHFAFWFYASACAFAFVFTVIFVPETKGKSLQEIQEMLSR